MICAPKLLHELLHVHLIDRGTRTSRCRQTELDTTRRKISGFLVPEDQSVDRTHVAKVIHLEGFVLLGPNAVLLRM